MNDSIQNPGIDNNNAIVVQISGSTTNFPFNTVGIMAGNQKDTLIDGKRITYGIQVDTPYQNNYLSFRNTKDIATARSDQSKYIVCKSLQITITNGKFNVYAKQE